MTTKELLIKLIEGQASAVTRLNAIDDNLAEHMRRTASVEGRTDRLERFMWMALGMVALSTFLGLGALVRAVFFQP
jgi:hypothetical protein